MQPKSPKFEGYRENVSGLVCYSETVDEGVIIRNFVPDSMWLYENMWLGQVFESCWHMTRGKYGKWA